MATVNLGRIKPVWKGAWNSSTQYIADDIVHYNQSAWTCLATNTNSAPSTGNSNWDLMALGTDIPSQTGNTGKALITDGSSLSWGTANVPSGSQLFTSNGTFTVPTDITYVFVSGAGGGGGGYSSWGHGGGGAASCYRVKCPVTAGNTISVTVGAGGAVATNGGASSFGTYVTLSGGQAGISGGTTGYVPGASGSLGNGATGIVVTGGSGKFSDHASAGHSEGGQTIWGYSGRLSDNGAAANNTVGFGAGGHAGWGTGATSTGASGFILVEW